MSSEDTVFSREDQTVEGLSVIAISYYAMALLGYVLKAFGEPLPVDTPVALGAAAPLVLGTVWYCLRRTRACIARGGRPAADGTRPRE